MTIKEIKRIITPRGKKLIRDWDIVEAKIERLNTKLEGLNPRQKANQEMRNNRTMEIWLHDQLDYEISHRDLDLDAWDLLIF